LGKFPPDTAPWRPFERKAVAAHRLGIQARILHRPGGDALAARLRELGERLRGSVGHEARFLEEFAARGHALRLLRAGLALRDRPGTRVATAPERAARMHQKNLECRRSATVDQQTGAAARALAACDSAHEGFLSVFELIGH